MNVLIGFSSEATSNNYYQQKAEYFESPAWSQLLDFNIWPWNICMVQVARRCLSLKWCVYDEVVWTLFVFSNRCICVVFFPRSHHVLTLFLCVFNGLFPISMIYFIAVLFQRVLRWTYLFECLQIKINGYVHTIQVKTEKWF